MKITKIFISVLCMLMVAVSVPAAAFASQGEIDIDNEPLLIVEFKDGEEALIGAKFDLFYIAAIDRWGNYYPKSGFENFDLNSAKKTEGRWRELSQTLEGYVLQNKMEPFDSKITGEDGTLFFPSDEIPEFPCGLYLLIGYPHTQGGSVYYAETAIVQLPGYQADSSEWNYDVTVKPKYSKEPVKEEKEYIDRKVLKIWNDKSAKESRPKEITVYLLCDGEVADTVKLNAENNWRYTWENLEKGYRWNVTEKIPEGYTAKITKEGITFVITNTPKKEIIPIIPDVPDLPDTPDEPKLPQTGQLWWPVPVLFVIGTAFIVFGVIRRRS